MNDAAVTIPVRAIRQLLLAVVALVIVALLVLAAWQQRDRLDFLTRGAGDQIDHATYQAVFMTGGQLYFGKLETHGETYFVLRDVYYLPPSDPQQPQSTGQLVKRGNELHAPQDAMIIPANAVTFIENLKPEGQVMQAILRYKASPTATPAPTAAPTAAPATPAPPTAAPATASPSASAPRPSPTR